MRYSEGIRLGATLKPQNYGAYYEDGKTCANGAALDAVGQLSQRPIDLINNRRLVEAFPIVKMPAPPCPACGATEFCNRTTSVEWLVAHLNDSPHHWTREAIADHIETLEPVEHSQGAEAITVKVSVEA